MKYVVFVLLVLGIGIIGGILVFGERNQTITVPDVTSETTVPSATSPTFLEASASSSSSNTTGTTSTVASTTTTTPTSTTVKITAPSALSVRLSDLTPYQGETVIIHISGNPRNPKVLFDTKNVPVFLYQDELRALIPIGAHESVGTHEVRATADDRPDYSRSIEVKSGKFPVIDLGIPEKFGTTTPAQLVQNLSKENADLNAIVALITPEVFFTRSFGLPLADNTHLGSVFGEIRKTGDQTISHLGVDFGGAEGSKVAAMNDGIVEKAESTTLYGNTVVIDHGEGIFSMYLHLKTILTTKGSKVTRGEVIGTLGQTGYSTGPHLHLSVKVNGVSVDPIKFVGAFK